jgi:hypothetical protein
MADTMGKTKSCPISVKLSEERMSLSQSREEDKGMLM